MGRGHSCDARRPSSPGLSCMGRRCLGRQSGRLGDETVGLVKGQRSSVRCPIGESDSTFGARMLRTFANRCLDPNGITQACFVLAGSSNTAFVLPMRTESKYHRDVVAETKSLEFDSLPLMAVEIRFHADSAAFKMNLRAAGRIEEAFLSHGLQADAVYDRREFPATKADISVSTPGLQQVVGKDSGTGVTVTLQDTMLKVEWQKQAGDQARPYPRYPALELEAVWAFGLMDELADGAAFSPTISNMTYVNFVPATQASGAASALGILRGRFRDAVPPDALQVHELNFRWRQPSGLDRGLLLAVAQREMGENKDTGFLLRTITGKRISGEFPIETLRQCHWDLQRFFEECTSEEARTG
jgi:hypothetical protein